MVTLTVNSGTVGSSVSRGPTRHLVEPCAKEPHRANKSSEDDASSSDPTDPNAVSWFSTCSRFHHSTYWKSLLSSDKPLTPGFLKTPSVHLVPPALLPRSQFLRLSHRGHSGVDAIKRLNYCVKLTQSSLRCDYVLAKPGSDPDLEITAESALQ